MYNILDTRKPWMAALLSLFFPGLGHIYGGCVWRGVLWFVSLYVTLLLFAVFTEIQLLSAFYTLFATHGLFYILIVLDAHRCVRIVEKRQYNHRQRLPIYILLGVVIWLVESYYLHHRSDFLGVENYRLASGSMAPRLQKGDFVIVDTREISRRDLSIGDVVVFTIAGEKDVFVKRIAALPHDQIEIRLGKVYRNDVYEPLLEVLDQRRRRPSSQTMPVLQVPAQATFMLGDWRDNSNDSRARGTVPLENILGKVTAIWFSGDVDRIGRLGKPVIIQQR